jgi:hypothetical protein
VIPPPFKIPRQTAKKPPGAWEEAHPMERTIPHEATERRRSADFGPAPAAFTRLLSWKTRLGGRALHAGWFDTLRQTSWR